MKIKHKCKYCKNEFESYSKTAKFCSRKCSNLGRDYRKLGTYKKCKTCGKTIYIARWEHNKKKYCSKKCMANDLEKIETSIKNINKWNKQNNNGKEKNNPRYIDGRFIYRKIAFTKLKNECYLCGEKEKKLLVHHKNKNRQDNRLKNLVILCYGCHKCLHRIEKIKKFNKFIKLKEILIRRKK